MTPLAKERLARLRVWIAYWRQVGWFYLWKWSMPLPRLHRRTIARVNRARQRYVDLHREQWRDRSRS